MMGHLASHPEIVACSDPPMEVRTGQYYAHIANVLLDRGFTSGDIYERTIVENKPWITANPYWNRLGAGWFGNEYQKRLLSLLKDGIQRSYLEEAQKAGKKVRYFAEKSVIFNDCQKTLRYMFRGYRELYLIRDPRAIISSILNFNKQRGSPAFGLDGSRSVAEYVEHLAVIFREFRDRVKQNADSSILLRYEDLVSSPTKELSRIFSKLDIASDAHTTHMVVGNTNLLLNKFASTHATTTSATASISAWKDSLPDEYRVAVENQMMSLLEYFRYER